MAKTYIVSSYGGDGRHVDRAITVHARKSDAMRDVRRRVGRLVHGSWSPSGDMLDDELAAAGCGPETRCQAIGYHESAHESCGGAVLVTVPA